MLKNPQNKRMKYFVSRDIFAAESVAAIDFAPSPSFGERLSVALPFFDGWGFLELVFVVLSLDNLPLRSRQKR